ncbi:phytoene/squalene synthase family protein [Halorarum halophilum]|uniref:Phytoene/squalene synthase family protein n=1 Tax=Halorarum halophilum TaxID=2743090 RepID=A0A7D5K5U0_9EURY|nr:phytoene/squalene synthase family protein [Halobaculum halophilum]QLG26159.1 phytoene/squalene synthase family protein [Halobaculum halophilum]
MTGADDPVARSKRIQQRTGRTFHFATRLLPERVRHPTYVLYAFFRVADEVVDAEDTAPPAEQHAQLERLREAALGRVEADDPVLAAFAEIREAYGIAEEDVEAFVDAMIADITTDRYETYADLEAYMDGSAAAVGRMMTAVIGPDDPDAALPHATALGEAFQLTNFVRDVREDIVDQDRVYLPRETLATNGVTEEQLRRFEFDENVAAAVRHELRRAESLYEEGVAGIEYLPRDCQFAVLLAAVLYAEHHRLVRRRGFDTLTATPSLGTARKAWLLVRTRGAWARTKDPEAVFHRVSATNPDGRTRDSRDHLDCMPAR